MKKLSIFFLIILSNLVTNVEAAEAQTPEEIRIQEMRESVQRLGAEYNRVSAIEDQPNQLTELENLEPAAIDTLDFLLRNQQYGIGGLRRARFVLRGIEADIRRLHPLVMDIDIE